MTTIRDGVNKLPPIEPSNGNGSKVKKASFDKPSARMLPEHPRKSGKTAHSGLAIPGVSVGKGQFYQVYQILINFIRDTSGGEKHG